MGTGPSSGTRRTRVLERGIDGSLVRYTELPNGVRVVTETVPGARSVSAGVWMGVGSVDESARLAGVSHFLEHLLFKGTHGRTGYEISAAVDAVGGELNAYTTHEYTCYYARMLADEAALAVSLVCEVVLDALVTSDDVETERSVILEEIAMRDDDPEDTLADAFASVIYAGHPVSAPVIGGAQTIQALTRTQVAGFYHRRYAPDRMVVAVAGGVDHAEVVRWVRAAFRRRAGRVSRRDVLSTVVRPAPPRLRSGRARPVPGTLLVRRETEQAHLSVGVPAGHRNHPDRAALAVLSAALGGGMSSRLFRSIREEHGLAYSCYAATAAYADVGSLSVYAGCQPERLGAVVKLIGQELRLIAELGISRDELRRAQGQLTGSLVLALEDTESRMSRIGKSVLVRTEYRTLDQELDEIRSVTTDQVRALAGELLGAPLSAAVVGPYAATDDLPSELTELVG